MSISELESKGVPMRKDFRLESKRLEPFPFSSS